MCFREGHNQWFSPNVLKLLRERDFRCQSGFSASAFSFRRPIPLAVDASPGAPKITFLGCQKKAKTLFFPMLQNGVQGPSPGMPKTVQMELKSTQIDTETGVLHFPIKKLTKSMPRMPKLDSLKPAKSCSRLGESYILTFSPAPYKTSQMPPETSTENVVLGVRTAQKEIPGRLRTRPRNETEKRYPADEGFVPKRPPKGCPTSSKKR